MAASSRPDGTTFFRRFSDVFPGLAIFIAPRIALPLTLEQTVNISMGTNREYQRYQQESTDEALDRRSQHRLCYARVRGRGTDMEYGPGGLTA
jgi:hypothetical protein